MKINRTPNNILRSRLERFQKKLQEKGIDAVMLRTLSSYTYFVGIKWLRPALLIPAEGDPIAFVARGEERFLEENTWIRNIETFTEGGELMSKVSRIIRESGFKTVGLEYGIERDAYILFFEMFKRLNPYVKVVDVSGLIQELRVIKDDYEISYMRKAGKIASKTIEKLLSIIREGLAETDIAAEAYNSLYKQGCESPHVYVNIGPWPRVHSEPLREIKVRKNVFVTIILAADYNSYYVNLSRTIYVGEPDETVRNALRCIDEVYDKAMELTRAGVRPVTVMKELDRIYAKYGLLEHRVSGYLHGVGLQVEEYPITTIVPGHRVVELRPRMALAFIHAPILLKGLGQVKHENTFIIRENGELEKL